jgi:hypothetical protein
MQFAGLSAGQKGRVLAVDVAREAFRVSLAFFYQAVAIMFFGRCYAD